jgi:hypothetical protein
MSGVWVCLRSCQRQSWAWNKTRNSVWRSAGGLVMPDLRGTQKYVREKEWIKRRGKKG